MDPLVESIFKAELGEEQFEVMLEMLSKNEAVKGGEATGDIRAIVKREVKL